MAFSITGQMKVGTLKKRFQGEFGLTLRVYDGRSFSDENKTIGEIRKKRGSGELSIRKSMKVGTLEKKIEEMFGIKTQIAGSDDEYLCHNEITLADALKRDQKRMLRKAKEGDQDSSNTSTGESNTQDKDSAKISKISTEIEGTSNADESLTNFVKKIFELASISVDVFESKPSIFDLNTELKNNLDVIEDNLSDKDGKNLISIANDISQEMKLSDAWKYSMIFKALQEGGHLEVPHYENIYKKTLDFADSWRSAVTLLSEGLNARGISDDSAESEFEEASDFALGCFYIGIELSCGVSIDDEWVVDGDEEGIDAWALGYGNPFEYDD
ncbi:MAG: hypothetical protein HOK41_04545, partial [Nitrospina sp.]|nr:hypothetical protein [Nitrospina sp.]